MLNPLPFVFSPPDASLLYIGRYDPMLVALSVVLAIMASYATLQVFQRVATSTSPPARHLWIGVGGMCMGAGIWSTHFIGMLAFSLPCATHYDSTSTLLSMIPGILSSMLAMTLCKRPNISPARQFTVGALLGAGIGTMHYSGMAAYQLDGAIRYNAKLFLLSILVAVILATLGIWIKFRAESWRGHSSASAVVGAIVMGLAISGTHYTAMAATYFVHQSRLSAWSPELAPEFLAYIVMICASVIIASSPRRWGTQAGRAEKPRCS